MVVAQLWPRIVLRAVKVSFFEYCGGKIMTMAIVDTPMSIVLVSAAVHVDSSALPILNTPRRTLSLLEYASASLRNLTRRLARCQLVGSFPG